MVIRVASLFMLLLLAPAARADELRLWLYPSPGLDWSTPKSIAQTTIHNVRTTSDHPIGHVSVEVTCDGQDPYPPAHFAAGATGASTAETARLILREGYGLGLLLHTYEGRLFTEEEIRAELPARAAAGRLSYLSHKINAATCARLVQYFTEYKARGYDKKYGLPNRPLKGEGAGCSAWGVSFLTVAGVMGPAYERGFAQTLKVPEKWVGGPLTGRWIPVTRFYNPLFPSAWAGPEEAGFPLHFYDPDLMHAWVKRVAAGAVRAGEAPALPYEVVRDGLVDGVVVDATAIPTPAGPIWEN